MTGQLFAAQTKAKWIRGSENRGRLVRAIVKKVEVDEPSGQVTAVLLDLDLAGGVPPLGTTATNDAEKEEVTA